MADVVFEEEIGKQFFDFIQRFSSESLSTPSQNGPPLYDYVDQVSRMRENDLTTLYVDFNHVTVYDDSLANAIEDHFYRLESFLCAALKGYIGSVFADFATPSKEFAVSFFNMPYTLKIRDLKTERVGRLSCVSGTVTRTSEVRPELVVGCFTCVDCGTRAEGIVQQFKYTEPSLCANQACKNHSKWTLDAKRSRFADWQRVRVQENTSEIPAGCMPRTLDVIVRDENVERAKAGDKAIFTGCLVVAPDVAGRGQMGERAEVSSKAEGRGGGAAEGVTGLKAFGCRELTYRVAFLASSITSADARLGFINIRDEGDDPAAVYESFSAAEKDEIDDMRAHKGIYSLLARSIAPSVCGHEEVKRGILLLLMGGVHKSNPEDGTRLRGDINACLVGDPSTAKSQFLKYVCTILPRAVYASGKASTAAGLTASVTRDEESGDPAIEAGALMLADNGICCIDEFDKMETKDQVAIHEAMEQQTISIAKAGIRATLNARASILAAANPTHGRYDRSKPLAKNLTLSAPIMSRFDLFFVILDECDEVADYEIARHIVKLHQHGSLSYTANRPEFTCAQLQRYIKYARAIKPTLSDEAKVLLVEFYARLRAESHAAGSSLAQRITVRQLEAMIRLSEAIARVHLDVVVKPWYVREAFRLLRKSVVHVQHADVQLDELDEDDIAEALVSAGGGLNGDDEGGEGGSPAAPPAKRLVVLSFEEFENMKALLIRRMRRAEATAAAAVAAKGAAAIGAPAGDEDGEIPEAEVTAVPEAEQGAMRRKDLAADYLELLGLSDLEELARRRKLVDLVITRLIAKEHVLVELPGPEGEVEPDLQERFLVLHTAVEA